MMLGNLVVLPCRKTVCPFGRLLWYDWWPSDSASWSKPPVPHVSWHSKALSPMPSPRKLRWDHKTLPVQTCLYGSCGRSALPLLPPWNPWRRPLMGLPWGFWLEVSTSCGEAPWVSHREPPLPALGWACLDWMKHAATWYQDWVLLCPTQGAQTHPVSAVACGWVAADISRRGAKNTLPARSCIGYISTTCTSDWQASSTAENSPVKAWCFHSSTAIVSQYNTATLFKWACCRAAAMSVCHALASASCASASTSWASFWHVVNSTCKSSSLWQ